MRMPLKASVALPWAVACLADRQKAEAEAQSEHEAACEAKIVEIQERGRWTLCAGRVPYTRAKAEELFDLPWLSFSGPEGYWREERGGALIGTFVPLKQARERVAAARALHYRLLRAKDMKVILDAGEVAMLSPYM